MKRMINILIVVFAVIGLLFTGVFIAMQFGWLNVRGTIHERNLSFTSAAPKKPDDVLGKDTATVLCQIHALAKVAPQTAKNIYNVYQLKQDVVLAGTMLQASLQRFETTNLLDQYAQCINATIPNTQPLNQTAYAWADSTEWSVMSSVFIRDQEIIRRAAADAGISPRLLLGGVIGEQFRFFTNARDSFKQYFEPLKILANLSKFSYGIAGLKPETVKRIDENLVNKDSVFYLGPEMEKVVSYPDDSDHDQVRFGRITDTKNTYYSYLYVGLFMRQAQAQWKVAGYDISNRPEVLATLYNLGFNRSIPKPDPGAGGAPIIVNSTPYNFGELAYQFYYSGELAAEFPY